MSGGPNWSSGGVLWAALGSFLVPGLLPNALEVFIDAFWEALGRQVGAKLEAKRPPWALLGGVLEVFLSALGAC